MGVRSGVCRAAATGHAFLRPTQPAAGVCHAAASACRFLRAVQLGSCPCRATAPGRGYFLWTGARAYSRPGLRPLLGGSLAGSLLVAKLHCFSKAQQFLRTQSGSARATQGRPAAKGVTQRVPVQAAQRSQGARGERGGWGNREPGAWQGKGNKGTTAGLQKPGGGQRPEQLAQEGEGPGASGASGEGGQRRGFGAHLGPRARAGGCRFVTPGSLTTCARIGQTAQSVATSCRRRCRRACPQGASL